MGEPNLDGALSGGLIEKSSFLLLGPPGAGKTTLAAQFVTTGLERDEDCLFVSTEQKPDELETSLSHIGFDPSHERLSVASVHAKKGNTVEGEEMILTELDDDGNTEDGFKKPFESEYIKEELMEESPCDRIVVDSISGLESLSSEPEAFNREIIDLIEFVTGEIGATAVFTAESTAKIKSDSLRYSVDGVLCLENSDVGGEEMVFGRVTKMRGTDHDRRLLGVVHDGDGVKLIEPFSSEGGTDTEKMSTGCETMNRFCGGGLLTGGSVVIEHDGLSSVDEIVGGVLDEAFSTGMAVSLTPTPSLLSSYPFDRLETEELLRNDRLFILDPHGFVEYDSQNVFTFESRSITEINETVNDRRDTRKLLVVGNIDVEMVAFELEEARRARYANSANLSEGDTVLNVLNSDSVDEETSAFYRSTSDQVLRIETRDGVCTVTLSKSPVEKPGKSALVSSEDEPPYYSVN